MTELKTNRVTSVEILGSEYRLVGEDDSYLKKLAQFVDSELRICSGEGMAYSSGRLGILTCLNIADQLYKLKSETLECITKLIDRIDKLLEDNRHEHILSKAEVKEAISIKS